MANLRLLPLLFILALTGSVLSGCTDNPVSSEVAGDSLELQEDLAERAGSRTNQVKFRNPHLMERALSSDKAGKSGDKLNLIFAVNKQRLIERYGIVERFRVLERYRLLERWRLLERFEYQHAFDGFAISIEDGLGLEDYTEFLTALAADDEILWFEPDFEVSTPEASSSGSPSGQMIPWNVAAIGARESWAASGDGAGSVDVDVYVLDTGVSHDDVNVASSMDFRPDADDASDVDGHGTHIAGTIAAVDDADGLVGVAPGARIHNMKVLGDDGTTDVSVVVAAVEHIIAAKQASPSTPMVVNMSLGEDIDSEEMTALDEAVKVGSEAGITFVVSAGNAGKDARKFTPAHVDEAITVGAYDMDGRFAGFSNHGPKVDLLAPGASVVSLAPGTDEPASMSGTSMAAAHVTGAAALYLAQNPAATPSEVRAALVASAKTFVSGAPNGTLVSSVWVGQQDTRLRVNLTNSNGQPISGQRVDLLRANGSYSGIRQNTDDAGTVAFDVDPALEYGVMVYHNGGARDWGGLRSGDVHVVQTVSSTLTLQDAAGNPISGQRVDLHRANGSYSGRRINTDASGQSTFQILPGYTHAFKVYHNGGALLTDTVADGEDLTVQTLPSTLTLVDAAGNPISGQRVDLHRANGSYSGRRINTDAAGQSTFQILPGYTHAFKVYHNGGALLTDTVADGENLTVQTLPSTLTLVDASGNPISGQRVDLHRANGSYSGRRINTDASGQSTFQILPGYSHMFKAYYDGAAYSTAVLFDAENATVSAN
ncbi:MAG: S8 family serine peptidase [Rhodothermales bacterium]|nr:S8 family serine peptidase [Rhodothermales bacterium]